MIYDEAPFCKKLINLKMQTEQEKDTKRDLTNRNVRYFSVSVKISTKLFFSILSAICFIPNVNRFSCRSKMKIKHLQTLV